MEALKTINLALAFLLELCMLAALGINELYNVIIEHHRFTS
jgi:hypothetical protein